MSKVCDHDWEFHSQTATSITHKCGKCGATSTQPKQTRAADFACLAAAVVIFLATLVPIFLAARVAP